MTATIALGELVAALRSAFREAQTAGGDQHVRRLDRYIGDDGTPLTRAVRLRQPNREGHLDVEIPLLALVPPTASRLDRLVFELDAHHVDLAEIGAVHEAAGSDGSVRASVDLVVRPDTSEEEPMLRIVVEESGAGPDLCVAVTDGATRDGPAGGLAAPRGIAATLSPVVAPPTTTGAGGDFVFTADARLVGEERIDVHEESAVVVVRIGLTQLNPASVWELGEATLVLDVDDLPPTITVLAANASWTERGLAFELGVLRPGETTDVALRVATGIFAEAQAADPGVYRIPAVVRAGVQLKTTDTVHVVEPVRIPIAPD